MSENAEQAGGAGPSHRSVELGVAGVMALLALIGIYGSLKVGIGWASDGPRAGFFPFYISLIVLIACVVNAAQVLVAARTGKIFAAWSQLRQVFSVLVPLSIYVALVPYIGMYVSSALLIAVFMRWFGRYNWTMVLAVAIVTPIAIFFLFEVWFLVPLPKGMLEHALGY